VENLRCFGHLQLEFMALDDLVAGVDEDDCVNFRILLIPTRGESISSGKADKLRSLPPIATR
jgi:hypothetical protein